MRILSIAPAALFAVLFAFAPSRPASAAHAPHTRPDVRVGILLFDGVQIIDFAAPYEVFGQAGFGITTISHDGKPVTTTMGLRVTPDHGFDDAPAIDVLLVPGGAVHDAQRDPRVLAFVRERTAAVRHVLSVCTGTYILAASGVLDGLEATTFHRAIGDLTTQYPKIKVLSDVRWTDNGRIITSAGLSSGIDSALHVIGRLRGEDVARATALHLEYDWRPDGGFVRTRMADRYLPELKDAPWPRDTRFEQVIAIGDTRHWRVRYRVTGPAEPEALLSIIDRSVDALPGWERDATAPGHRWKNFIDQHPLTLAFVTHPSAIGEGYELEAAITVAGTEADDQQEQRAKE